VRFGFLELEVPLGTYPVDPPTIMVAEEAERRLPHNGRLLDLGCGVGNIGLWVAKRSPLAKVVGVDVNENAVLASKRNASLNNVFSAQFLQSDVYENVEGKFDVIACTLPWEDEAAYPDGTPGPREAFVDDDSVLARGLGYAKDHLYPGGYVVMWGPCAVGHRVFPMVGLTVYRYVFDVEENSVVIGYG